jgi:hypothetical protein
MNSQLKATRATSKAESKQRPTKVKAENSEGLTVQFHELRGLAVISLPRELAHVLSKEDIAKIITQIQENELTLVLRNALDVIHIRMPVIAENPAAGWTRLKTAPPPRAGKEKPKASKKRIGSRKTKTPETKRGQRHD